jgi:chorismate mutase
MRNIFGVFNISSNNAEEFYKQLSDIINKLQQNNQEVEIQYNTQIINNSENPILYSALLLGRKETN